jgi:hypothetical protein
MVALNTCPSIAFRECGFRFAAFINAPIPTKADANANGHGSRPPDINKTKR